MASPFNVTLGFAISPTFATCESVESSASGAAIVAAMADICCADVEVLSRLESCRLKRFQLEVRRESVCIFM